MHTGALTLIAHSDTHTRIRMRAKVNEGWGGRKQSVRLRPIVLKPEQPQIHRQKRMHMRTLLKARTCSFTRSPSTCTTLVLKSSPTVWMNESEKVPSAKRRIMLPKRQQCEFSCYDSSAAPACSATPRELPANYGDLIV